MKAIVVGLALLGIAASARAVDRAELNNRIRKLTIKFEQMQQKPDRRIPAEMLRQAQGIILLDRTKAGFLFAFQGGSGVAMVRDPESGKWSPAAFLSANEVSVGFQIGGQQSFLVILLMTTDATRRLTEPSFEFGGEARGTAGDSSAGEEGTITSHEWAMLVYANRQGLYGGAILKAGALSPDSEANLAYYSQAVTMRDILFDRQVNRTEAASELAEQVAKASAGTAVANVRPAGTPTGGKVKPAEPALKPARKAIELKPGNAAASALVSRPPTNAAIQQLQLLMSDLNARRQTNALRLLNGYLSAMLTTQQTKDADMTILILEQLRARQTSEAVDLLELQLDGALIDLGASLEATPEKARQPIALAALRRARQYRTRFPRKTGNPSVDAAVARAFSLLDKQQ